MKRCHTAAIQSKVSRKTVEPVKRIQMSSKKSRGGTVGSEQ